MRNFALGALVVASTKPLHENKQVQRSQRGVHWRAITIYGEPCGTKALAKRGWRRRTVVMREVVMG